jgi:cell division septation protein DedD
MPKNEDGEFELILGNRQLLSVFFIVVILLGVFFTMGYIVGRNSAPVIATDSGPNRKNDSKPLVVESASKVPEPTTTSAPKETAVQQPPEPVPVKEPEPEKPKEKPKAEPVKAEPEKPKETAKERRAEAKAKKEAATAKLEKAKPETGAPSGTYLQLAATSQREAEIMVDVLRKKEFKAMAAEVPEKAGLFRVLVGPLADSAINRTRTDLQGAGFPGDKAIKKTF